MIYLLIIFYIAGCILAYRTLRKDCRQYDLEYTQIDRVENLLLSAFSWIIWMMVRKWKRPKWFNGDKSVKW